MLDHSIIVGTAGWSIPKTNDAEFPAGGSHLERYAGSLRGVEINSSFYRPHRLSTYQRWADTVPDDFRFAIKMPKAITHEKRLRDVDEPLQRFLAEITGLSDKLGPMLVQLPPSLKFDPASGRAFFEYLRSRFEGDLVCEPRHATWFTEEGEDLLIEHRVARVVADPRPHPDAGHPGGWRALAYYRLHGSPRMYYSDYPGETLIQTAHQLRQLADAGTRVWCIFDNTAAFAATPNALETAKLVS